MCYRVATPKKDDLSKLLGEGFKVDDWDPYFHIAGHTTPGIPVISASEPRRVQQMQWGVKPWWIDNPADKAVFHNRTLNTMAEYWKADKPPHEHVKLQKRCVVFVDGFYEYRWEDEKGRKKTPYFIYKPDPGGASWPAKEPFAMAGLQWQWVNEETGQVYESASILTTKSNQLLSHIHNNKMRMPVILDRENWDTWLQEDISKEEYKRLTASYRDDVLKGHVLKNNPAKRDAQTDVPEIQAPLVEDAASGTPSLF